VPLLREKLSLPAEASDLYDAKLAAAVKKFQQANELPATGSLDARTIKQLNAPVGGGRQTDLIVANMERWRWYPRDLGPDHVVVNEPDFTLKVMHNGSQVWTTKVVIGDPSGSKQTPLLSETMKSITVNPTWNVPPSIVYGEYLPALARDPTVLARMGLIVSYGRDGSVVNISQPPGGNSVLGRLRFNFPNRFLVYQHDTNEKFMFAHETRAYSHGCMRIYDPAKYAEVLLNLARPNEHPGFSYGGSPDALLLSELVGSLIIAPIPTFRPRSIAIGRTCRAKREWIALTESAVTPARGLALLKRIETAVGRASLVAEVRTPRTVSVRPDGR
jgi:murein L,D-transpeptidase YcbB/YkuD